MARLFNRSDFFLINVSGISETRQIIVIKFKFDAMLIFSLEGRTALIELKNTGVKFIELN